MRQVDYFFDPLCPFSWMTSRWMRRVAPERDLAVTWRFMSLWMLNEGADEDRPTSPDPSHALGLRYLRVAAAIRDAHGDEAVGRFYEALGEVIWETVPEGIDDVAGLRAHHLTPLDLAPVLVGLGLDPALAAAVEDEGFDGVIGDETQLALQRAGAELGTPVVCLDPPSGPAYFGPVISELPDDVGPSLALWDALEVVATFPGFAELKTSLRSMPRTAFLERVAAVSG